MLDSVNTYLPFARLNSLKDMRFHSHRKRRNKNDGKFQWRQRGVVVFQKILNTTPSTPIFFYIVHVYIYIDVHIHAQARTNVGTWLPSLAPRNIYFHYSHALKTVEGVTVNIKVVTVKRMCS